MEVAGRCVAKAHQAIREAARPGLTTIELNQVAERVIRGEGCVPSFLGYRGFPASICASPNDVIVHGIPDFRRLRSGDLLSVDVGAIYEGFHGDAACTFAVGEVSGDAAALSATTEKALWTGLRQARPGRRIGDIGAAVEAVARPHGYGVVEGYVGHGIGRQMHEKPDVPNVGRAGKGVKLPCVSNPCLIWAAPAPGSIPMGGRCGPPTERFPHTGNTLCVSLPTALW